MTNTVNDQLVLIAGESGSGKSASLINLPNHERVMYLNCEAGKKLPFR
jgi:ABC-type lipoprotein export system ATPase subunit